MDLRDPRWLPLSYEARGDSFLFASVDLDLLGQAAFLDQRLTDVWQRSVAVSAADAGVADSATEPAWLFHTAFCCSTLLARALHAPPDAVALKEPQVLLDLTRLSLDESLLAPGLLEHRLLDAVRLLGRPWKPGGRILIKPTNAVNRLLPNLLAAAPASRALLLFGGLEDFLLSCVKKLPGAEEPMRWMAQYLLPGTRLQKLLGIPEGHRFNFVESCVLTWHAQIERYSDALAADSNDRLRSLDMQVLLAQPMAVVQACAGWLGLDNPASAQGREARVEQVFSRNSKQTDAAYGPERRAAERVAIMARYGELVNAALAWSDNAIAPHTRQPGDWKPLPVPGAAMR
ncbi:MAG TPA: hypothetical protein VGD21_14640 [Lysobacter sp.]